MQQLKFFKDDLIAHYGTPLQRIGFDLALGCPNREGGFGAGCTFCAADGSRARHLTRNLDLAAQAQAGIDYVRRRYHTEGPYIAYFQSFTNTNAPVARLRALYDEALALADFPVVMISTRPDALPEPVLDWLAELNRDREVWVELGVQSAHNATLARIRRGHDWQASAAAIAALDRRGIRVAAHLILGLPGESPDDWRATARQLAQLPVRGVKIHQLMVLKHTELAREYHRGEIPVLNEYEYASGLAAVLRELPEETLLMRLTAEAGDDELIAPRWWMSKGQFLEYFRRRWQENDDAPFPSVLTADGSRTLYHPEYRQHFHSLAGAAGEAEHKFVAAAHLSERLRRDATVKLLDVGFGLGGNTLAALHQLRRETAGAIAVTALELDLRVLKAARGIAPEADQPVLAALEATGRWEEPRVAVTLLSGDARATVQTLPEHKFDLIFLDAFSPDVNPELWSFHFLRQLRRVLARDGVLVTYSSAFPVRGALLKLGFAVGETTPFGRKRGGTIAAFDPAQIETPLSAKERAIILSSTAGLPYSDRTLETTKPEIQARRERILRRLRARGVPKWAKFDGE